MNADVQQDQTSEEAQESLPDYLLLWEKRGGYVEIVEAILAKYRDVFENNDTLLALYSEQNHEFDKRRADLAHLLAVIELDDHRFFPTDIAQGQQRHNMTAASTWILQGCRFIPKEEVVFTNEIKRIADESRRLRCESLESASLYMRLEDRLFLKRVRRDRGAEVE